MLLLLCYCYYCYSYYFEAVLPRVPEEGAEALAAKAHCLARLQQTHHKVGRSRAALFLARAMHRHADCLARDLWSVGEVRYLLLR